MRSIFSAAVLSALVLCAPILAAVPASADTEIPAEWIGVWELEISVYDCNSEDLIFSTSQLDTICPGTVVEEPEPDEVNSTCTTEVDANSYTIHCEGSEEAFPGCTVSYVYDAMAIREGDSYTVTSVQTISYGGDCFDLPDTCQRVEVTGTRIDATDEACPTAPLDSQSWSAVKSIYR